MIKVTNMPRRSLQIDSDFAFIVGLERWPRYWKRQDAMLSSGGLSEGQKQSLQNWIESRDERGPVDGGAK